MTLPELAQRKKGEHGKDERIWNRTDVGSSPVVVILFKPFTSLTLDSMAPY